MNHPQALDAGSVTVLTDLIAIAIGIAAVVHMIRAWPRFKQEWHDLQAAATAAKRRRLDAAVAAVAGRPDLQWRELVAALIEGFIEDDSSRRNARAFASAWVSQPQQVITAGETATDPTASGPDGGAGATSTDLAVAPAPAIIAALAAARPFGFNEALDTRYCTICGAIEGAGDRHLHSCAWRLAREATGQTTEWSGGETAGPLELDAVAPQIEPAPAPATVGAEDPEARRRRIDAIAHSISSMDIDTADLVGLVLELADLAEERLPVLVGMFTPSTQRVGAVWREPDGAAGLDMSKELSDAALDVWGEVRYAALLHDSHSGGYVRCSSCGEIYDVDPVFPCYTCPDCGHGADGDPLDEPGAKPSEPGPVDHSEEPF